jgi:protocatechuate 3,4-dioxygenase beta subunit
LVVTSNQVAVTVSALPPMTTYTLQSQSGSGQPWQPVDTGGNLQTLENEASPSSGVYAYRIVNENGIVVWTYAPPRTLTTVSISASSTSVQAGGSDTITATADDQYGRPLAGAVLYLWQAYDNGGAVQVGASQTTGSNGQAVFDVSFVDAGSYSIYVSDDSGQTS